MTLKVVQVQVLSPALLQRQGLRRTGVNPFFVSRAAVVPFGCQRGVCGANASIVLDPRIGREGIVRAFLISVGITAINGSFVSRGERQVSVERRKADRRSQRRLSIGRDAHEIESVRDDPKKLLPRTTRPIPPTPPLKGTAPTTTATMAESGQSPALCRWPILVVSSSTAPAIPT